MYREFTFFEEEENTTERVGKKAVKLSGKKQKENKAHHTPPDRNAQTEEREHSPGTRRNRRTQ